MSFKYSPIAIGEYFCGEYMIILENEIKKLEEEKHNFNTIKECL